MIYELVDCKDPILREELPEFDFANPLINPVELYNNLGETMIAKKGMGLAANQCGLPFRAFVISAEEVIGVFNPIIVDLSEEQIYLEEGCLSYTNLWIKVKRPRRIKVRYQNPLGEHITQVIEGITARVFLHELDHLDGIVHTDRANNIHLQQAKNKKKKIERQIKQINKIYNPM